MRPNCKKIKDKLDSDATLAAKSDSEVASDLNAATIDVVGAVSQTDLLVWMAAGDKLKNVKAAAADSNNAVYAPCNIALILIEPSAPELDLSKADRVALVDALVAAGIFTADDKTALTALATTKKSWAQTNGMGNVRAGWVTYARSL